ncbi:MAG: VWA domain-containing protein [Deltaproteobacteria bacterium]|nr:VWA domain-containing protein [Deltaproteobacteria bacterium]
MTGARSAAAAWLALAACTDVGLYSEARPRVEPDRVTLTGRACAEDPLTARYPVRVVLLVDQAQGPLFAAYDPSGLRVRALAGFVQSALGSSATSFAIVSYAGRARTLAPAQADGLGQSFTRNPGELLSALEQLGIAEPCLAQGQCRDYLDGLRSARALIEGDMATLPAGTRVLTQYVVIHVAAGPQAPLALVGPGGEPCDPSVAGPLGCQRQREVAEVTALREAVGAAGAGGLRYHVVHLMAEVDGADDEALAVGLREMAFAGRGLYRAIGAAGALAPDVFDVLDVRTELRVKHLVVANVNARPTPDGPAIDSDGDGLSDAEELTANTSPGARDSDGDGIGDLVEVLLGLPADAPDDPVACRGLARSQDADRDGLSDCDERLLGTDPSLVDSDGDGAPDRLELVSRLDYLHADAEGDADGDGIANGVELQQRTDPRSSDVASSLAHGYRYDVEDEGLVEERYVAKLQIDGVEVTAVSGGSTPGLGLLEWFPALGEIRWRDAAETAIGPLVPVGAGGELTLPAASFAPIQGDEGRFIRVVIEPDALPDHDVHEGVRVGLRVRHCVAWTVRNVRLLATSPRDDDPDAVSGRNEVLVYLAQSPEGRLTVPGPVRVASIPFVYTPPARREPAGAEVIVYDEELVTPRIAP